MSLKVTGVNPRILKWARERAKYSLEDVAGKFKKDIKIIEKWESGEESPTYAQLEKLAYTIYKRPLALFFFPEPPEEPDEQQEFRTLPDFEVENLSSDTMYALRQAKAMKLSLKEINDNINPSTKKIFRDFHISFSDHLSQVTQEVRNYLNVSLEEQISWKDNDTALKLWRNQIEESGIFIFKRSMQQKDISGFCLIDEEFPIIYLNNSVINTRQIFTIFHELAHILLNINGITKIDNSYINILKGDNKKIEVFCNRFAAEFVLPSNEFIKVVSGQDINNSFIIKTASKYKVSREVVLRKLLDTSFITQDEYNLKIKLWQEEYASKNREENKKTGGNYYATQAIYLGENYLNLVFNKYYQGKLNIEQVADYLNIEQVETVEKFEQYLLERKNILMGYIFDTSSFKVLNNYFPQNFPTVWDKINLLVAESKLLSVNEVLNELQVGGNSQFIIDWIKFNKNIFLKPTQDEMSFIGQIFAVKHFQDLVSQKARLKGTPVADPFILDKITGDVSLF